MPVKMLTSLSGPEVDWPSGSEQPIEPAEAWRLVDAGFAEWAGTPPARPVAVAPVEAPAEAVAEPELADVQPAAEVAAEPVPEAVAEPVAAPAKRGRGK